MRVMSDWLYQYWFFCFKTAKNWGRGPRNWTAEMLDFASFSPQLRPSLPGTPNDSNQRHNDQGQSEVPHPTDLCRWLIHVSPDSGEHYEQVEEEEVIQDPGWQDPQDESTWSPWPREWQEPPLPARLRDALEHTDFSNIPSAALPVAVPEISKAAQRSPDELILESLGFSVMSRNLGQVEVLLRKVSAQKLDFASLYPFHLATSYLDGYKTCCEVLAILLAHGRDLKFREMYENELGHTVLDNLMISVLKSHSSSTPAVIDESVKDKLRFAGEEVDICGRWDADSPCMRHLLAQGNPSTPFTWKHKFCHTSTQTICHCFITISQSISSSFLWDTPSGLYVRRCFNCGMKLQLLPLHALVMTAYHLANNSCDDEDLFGMLALLLCFISRRADPRVSADISVSALLKKDMPELACDHIKQNAAELAEHISMESTVTSWSSNTRIGWDVFCGVLRLCVDSWPDSSEDDESLSDDDPIEENVILGEWDSKLMDMHLEIHDYTCLRHCKDLASLWASVQAEMLSYRRLDKDLSWISPNFSIEKLHRQLQNGEPIATPYMENGLLKAYCICGEFRGWPFATLPDVTDPNIANLDIWDRASYIPLREE